MCVCVCVCVCVCLHGTGLREDVGVDVHHEVATGSVLHDEAHMLTGLEAGKQVHQERVPHAVHRLKDTLLAHKTKQGWEGRVQEAK